MQKVNNAFNWQGQPSIFSTGKTAADFNGTNSRRSELASESAVPNTISMPNSSLFLPPKIMGPKRAQPKGKRHGQ
jgi:hypothetical protein